MTFAISDAAPAASPGSGAAGGQIAALLQRRGCAWRFLMQANRTAWSELARLPGMQDNAFAATVFEVARRHVQREPGVADIRYAHGVLTRGRSLLDRLQTLHDGQTGGRNALVRELRNMAAQWPAHNPRTAPAPVADPSRTTEQALHAFGNPSHMRVQANGLIVPDVRQLRWDQQQAWQHLASKFSVPTAQKLFDANARGGVLQVMQTLDRERLSQTLTVQDMARLHFLVLTPGMPDGSVAQVRFGETLHDAMHTFSSYGVNAFEEVQGNGHTDSIVRQLSLFGRLPPSDSRHLNLYEPLSKHPEAVRQIDQYIRSGFALARDNAFGRYIETGIASAADFGTRENFDLAKMVPAHEAAQAFQALGRGGLLTELDAAQLMQLRSLVFGADRPNTYESIVVRYQQSKDYPRLNEELSQWSEQAGKILRQAWEPRFMTEAQFREKATRAVAAAMLVIRIAPGQKWGITGMTPPSRWSFHDAPGSLNTMDLRREYPKVLREVRAALAPFARQP